MFSRIHRHANPGLFSGHGDATRRSDARDLSAAAKRGLAQRGQSEPLQREVAIHRWGRPGFAWIW